MVGVARGAAAIELSAEEEVELRRLVRAPSTRDQQALRARIVLRAAAGVSNTVIAEELGLSLPTVGLWRSQFAREGLDGLAGAREDTRAATGRREPLERAPVGA